MSASSFLPFAPARSAALALAAAFLLFPQVDTAEADGFGFANFSAQIKKNGSTVRSSGVQGSSRTATGRYVVEFSRDISTCLYVASPFGNKSGQIAVNRFPGDPTKIRVSTFAPNGQRANYHFIVLVSCS